MSKLPFTLVKRNIEKICAWSLKLVGHPVNQGTKHRFLFFSKCVVIGHVQELWCSHNPVKGEFTVVYVVRQRKLKVQFIFT